MKPQRALIDLEELLLRLTHRELVALIDAATAQLMQRVWAAADDLAEVGNGAARQLPREPGPPALDEAGRVAGVATLLEPNAAFGDKEAVKERIRQADEHAAALETMRELYEQLAPSAARGAARLSQDPEAGA